MIKLQPYFSEIGLFLLNEFSLYLHKNNVMKINKVYSVYFSATYTTRKIVNTIAKMLSKNIIEYDVTSTPIEEQLNIVNGDVLVIGMPVYGGRIPQSALQSISLLNGNNAPAIICCVYGNRDYDDALMELNNEVVSQGFKIVSAGAFVARHSIFTHIANDRPNNNDLVEIKDFSIRSKLIIGSLDDLEKLQPLVVKGNAPYKVFNQLPIHPSGDDSCIDCKVCASKCPVGAISIVNPRETDECKCISCGRCIVECKVGARDFRGDFFESRVNLFNSTYSSPRENECYYASVLINSK